VDPSGKRVLLTGASGGLGARLAAALARSGASVTLSGRDRQRLEALIEDLPGEGHQVAVVDLGKPGGAEELVREVGAVDCLVANAALPATGRITDLSGDEVAMMLRVNLEAPIHLTQAFLPGMIERGEGKVVLMGSLAGKAGSPRSSVYNATKFAVWAVNEGMNIDLLGTNIRVSSVDPGLVETEFSQVRFHGDTKRAQSVYADTTPLTGDDVADAVLYVANTPEHVDVINLVLMPTVQRHAMLLHRTGG
jgi:serine 3-dehydrogenase